jgi:hypothetical protein
MKQFKEGLNTAVFTTRFVIDDNTLITNIFHYEDGSWQFNGDQDQLTDSDYKIISLGEAIMIDDTITEVSDMPTGYHAFRNSKSLNWTIELLVN